MTFGDKLFDLIQTSRGNVFLQGELAQLTYTAYQNYIDQIKKNGEEIIEVEYPVGFKADNTPIYNTNSYTKDELIGRYQHLSLDKLPIDGILKLVTITETVLNDLLKAILIEYPIKIPNKKKIDVEKALSVASLDELKLYIVDNIINDFAYKSPTDYAADFENHTGINLLKNPAYHKYIEIKATRDIHIHNSGLANEIYLKKSSSLSRVKNGEFLPVTMLYFLQSYETCLQLSEFLEIESDKIWPSEEQRKRRKEIKDKLSKSDDVKKAKENVVEKEIEKTKKQNQDSSKI